MTVVPFAEMPLWYQIAAGVTIVIGAGLLAVGTVYAIGEMKKTGDDPVATLLANAGITLMLAVLASMFIVGAIVPTVKDVIR